MIFMSVWGAVWVACYCGQKAAQGMRDPLQRTVTPHTCQCSCALAASPDVWPRPSRCNSNIKNRQFLVYQSLT